MSNQRRDVLRLALEADLCFTSAKKALREGPQSLRGDAGARAAEAMRRLGLSAEGGAVRASGPAEANCGREAGAPAPVDTESRAAS